MPNQEEIQQQQQLLNIYRRNLAQLLIQQAQLGGQAHTPIGIINSIQEARDCIQRIKTNLSNWGIYIEDSIDEEPFGRSQSVLSSVFPSGPYLQTFIGRDLKDSSLQILLKSFGEDVMLRLITTDLSTIQYSTEYGHCILISPVVSHCALLITSLMSFSYMRTE